LTGNQTGGSSIMYYDLAWDFGSGGLYWESYSNVTETFGESIIKQRINGLSSGDKYKFKYIAINIHGWSSNWSDKIEVKTLTVPQTISSIKTKVMGGEV
jgi:hypothetical protein